MLQFFSAMSTMAFVYYLYVGIKTYQLNRKSREGRVFLSMNISMAIWSFSYAFAYSYMEGNAQLFSLWNKFSAIGWCTFSSLALYLVLIITKNKLINHIIVKVIIFIPSVVFLSMTVFLFGPNIETSKLVSDFFYIGNFIYNFSFLLLSILIMFLWGKKSTSSNHKKQAHIIVIASVLPFLLNLFTQTILPMFGFDLIPNAGQIYSIIMLWGVNYAIVNYQFMEIPSSLINKELFNDIHDMTFLLNPEGTVKRINKQVMNILHYSENEVLDHPIKDMIQDEGFLSELSRSEIITEPIKLKQIKMVSKDGRDIAVYITISPLIHKKNHILMGLLIVARDVRFIKKLKEEIQNHKQTSEKLQKSEMLFRTMIEILPYAIVLNSFTDDKVLYINSKMEEVFRVKRSEVVGKTAIDFYYRMEDRNLLKKMIQEGRPIKEKEMDFKRSDNSMITGLLSLVKTVYNEEEVMLTCFTDISEQKKLQQEIAKSEELLKKLMNSIPDLVIVTDLHGNLTYYNTSITILGYHPGESDIPNTIFSILEEQSRGILKENTSKMFSQEIGSIEYTIQKKNGSLLEVDVNSSILRENEKPFGMIYVIRDITERKKDQERLQNSRDEIEQINSELLKTNALLQEKSIRDSLTGLYNHQHINELLEIEIQDAEQHSSNLCVMMLDIDNFKRVNDTFGHQIGDTVLVTVSKLMQQNINANDFVGRYGGEEFIIILTDNTLEEAYQIADKIRRSVEEYNFKREGLKVTISIGLSKYNSESVKSFVNRADTLLYQAKKNGKNRTEYK